MPRQPKSTLPLLTDEEVKDLAIKILHNEVFTDSHIRPSDMNLAPSIFMVLAFMDRKTMLDLKRKQRPGMIYAPMSEAGPRAINGYPIFSIVHLFIRSPLSKFGQNTTN